MTRATATLIAVCLGVSAAFPAAAQSVTVLRGTGDEEAGRTTAAGIEILRGMAIVKRSDRTRYAGRTRTTRYQPFVAAGDTLWLRHARTGRLVACWVQGTGYVGRSAIRCTSY